EESSILRFPAVTIRNAIERPEAMDTGSIIMTGHDMDTIVNAVSLALDETTERKFTSLPTDYAIRDTSWRVLKLILGLSKLSNRWANIAPETEITYK
ncbi:MAG TPA: UDP-N-acetylglucosamine 2-epimerase (non-hydrolyzing), partial [Marinilabiliales bacterium]|nr:UDP-N-acetylglucosamine 2-epimerase (non-hydrolyzing) [Marinilabiliales bacterium]